jgi:hypothetical protein
MLRTILLSLAIIAGCATRDNTIDKNQEIKVATVTNQENVVKEELQSDKEPKMQEFLNSTIGTSAVLLLVYIAGGVTFSPVWNWVKGKIPFINK